MSEINNKKLFNIVGFYLCWLVAILGAANSYFFIGPLFVMFFFIFPFFLCYKSKKRNNIYFNMFFYRVVYRYLFPKIWGDRL